MNNSEAYTRWANNYDTVINSTRDLEGKAFREILSTIKFDDVLEIGCGTGKNTEWLLAKSKSIIAADFSEGMLAKAKTKIDNKIVQFIKTDVREQWLFNENSFDLISFSLVLEHIENIDFIFKEAKRVLKPGGFLYIGELHPFKQYAGSKARFDVEDGVFELECFIHNISDYLNTAKKHQFECVELMEWFDDNNAKDIIPRLLTIVFKLNF